MIKAAQVISYAYEILDLISNGMRNISDNWEFSDILDRLKCHLKALI